MSNLVPERRVDKNGRLVTRHVKSDSTPIFGRSSIPRPTVHYYDATTAIEYFMDTLDERGAMSGNIPDIAQALSGINEETRIIAMTALDDYPSRLSTVALVHALRTNDEQYIRSVSLGMEFCTDYLNAILLRTSGPEENHLRMLRALLSGLHDRYKDMNRDRTFQVSDYDSERDAMITNVFKATVLADSVNMQKKVPFHFEYHQQLGMLVDRIDDVGDAVHGIIEIKTARRHWAVANKKSVDAISMDASELLTVVDIVRDYPHANDRFYDIVVDRGSFVPDLVRSTLEASGAPALDQGAL